MITSSSPVAPNAPDFDPAAPSPQGYPDREAHRDADFKSGFVALLGRSNSGKSTLLNSLVGSKIAITTPKAQTTRDLIQGVIHDPRGQAVLIDTPGFFHKAHDALTAKMTQKAKNSIDGADLVLYIVDPEKEIKEEESTLLAWIKNLKLPKILVINKIDVYKPRFLEDYRDLAEYFSETIEVSAHKKQHLKPLKDLIFKYLPEGQPYYPDYQLTSMENKTWFAELIREKVFLLMGEEIPYHIKVDVSEITKRDNGLLFIKADILTARLGHKKMLIGAGGKRIKQIGSLVRKELEQILDNKVYLELEVQVKENWVEDFE